MLDFYVQSIIQPSTDELVMRMENEANRRAAELVEMQYAEDERLADDELAEMEMMTAEEMTADDELADERLSDDEDIANEEYDLIRQNIVIPQNVSDIVIPQNLLIPNGAYLNLTGLGVTNMNSLVQSNWQPTEENLDYTGYTITRSPYFSLKPSDYFFSHCKGTDNSTADYPRFAFVKKSFFNEQGYMCDNDPELLEFLSDVEIKHGNQTWRFAEIEECIYELISNDGTLMTIEDAIRNIHNLRFTYSDELQSFLEDY